MCLFLYFISRPTQNNKSIADKAVPIKFLWSAFEILFVHLTPVCQMIVIIDAVTRVSSVELYFVCFIGKILYDSCKLSI